MPERASGKPVRRAARRATRRATGPDSPLSAAEVAAYLRCHADFLTDNPDLVEVLTPPPAHCGEGIVDLQRFLVERLRQQISELSGANEALIAVGRANMVVQARVHRAILALLAARSFEHLIETVTTDLEVILDLDAVALGVEQATGELPPVRFSGLVQLQPGTVDALIGRGRGVTFQGAGPGRDALFGAAAGLVESHALIRLSISPTTPPAALALGSRRGDLFQHGQRTELLSFLAGALEQCIRAWLKLPN